MIHFQVHKITPKSLDNIFGVTQIISTIVSAYLVAGHYKQQERNDSYVNFSLPKHIITKPSVCTTLLNLDILLKKFLSPRV